MKALAVIASGMLFSAGGCAAVPVMNWPEHQRPPSATEARIIVSGARPVNCGSTIFTLLVAREGARSSTVAEATVDGDIPSDFKYESGKVSVIPLEPGSYVIYPNLSFELFGNSNMTPPPLPRFNFEARAGEVTYIGNLFIEGSCETRGSGASMKDQQARDVAVVIAKNPEFNNVPVVKRLATPRQP